MYVFFTPTGQGCDGVGGFVLPEAAVLDVTGTR